MKKIILTSITIAALVVSSCHKDLDQLPLSTTTADNFFASTVDFEQALVGVYSTAFHGTYGDNYGYPNRVLNLSETRSDNLYAITSASRDWEGINNFFSSITVNGLVEEAYIVNYNSIYKANLLLQKIDEKADEFFNDPADIDQMIAETRFLRAFCYFDLVRYFGRVPLIDAPISPQEAANVGQASVTELYNFIIADLEAAIDVLEPVEDNNGRVNQYWAKSLLGLVYMTRSSPDYGRNGELPGLGTNDWQAAYDALEDVYLSGAYAFEDSIENIYNYEGAANTENIIFIPYADINEGVGGSWISTVTSDQYFSYLGMNSSQGGIEERPVSNTFADSFDPADKRYQFGIIDTFTVADDGDRYAGYFSPDPIMIKFADPTRYGSGRTDWGVDFPVIRFTDVMMMMAECQLRGASGSLVVDDVINDVRERAGLARDAAGSTLDDLFEERRKEFFNEGKRWFDLYRSGDAITTMEQWRADNDQENRVNDIKVGYLIYPIPQREFNTAPGLYTQNRDYN